MSIIVILAEKANAGRDIVNALELKNIRRTNAGFPIGEDASGNKVVVTHSVGHCLRLQEPEEIDRELKKWSLDTLPIPFTSDKLVPIKGKEELIKGIGMCLKDADIIINAGDAGREGELIQRWIIKYANCHKPIYRLWASSLTKSSIKKAYDNLLGDREEEQCKLQALYEAGEARAIMDKYLGYNYTRLISLAKTDGVTVTYGRCQAPLRNAIIKRDDEIENFIKRKFYYIRAKCDNGLIAVLAGEDNKRIEYDSRNDCKEILLSIGQKASVIKVEKEKKIVNPTLPYDILNIQKAMSKMYDFEADKTLSICQSLYDKHKILSYPRTDSRYLTSDLKDTIKENLSCLMFGSFKPYVQEALKREIPDRYFNDKKVADHHALIPIVPDGKLEEIYEELSEDEVKVFDELAKNFIALFLPAHEYNTITITLNSNGYKFIAKGKEVIVQGFKVLKTDIKDPDSEMIEEESVITSNIVEGDITDIIEKEAVEGETKPKSHYTTATLLDFMKIHNIGTGATRDTLIKELTEKKGNNKDSSIQKRGKYYIATDFGRRADALIPEKLKSIEYLSYLDTKLSDIENEKLTSNAFLNEIRNSFMDELNEMKNIEDALMRNEKKKKDLGLICPVCGGNLLDRSSFYGCENWKKDGTGCHFSIFKIIAGKEIPLRQVRELLSNGRTSKELTGFKSKAGKKFNANIVFELEGEKAKLRFDFGKE